MYRIIIKLAAITLLTFIFTLLTYGEESSPEEDYPWNIEKYHFFCSCSGHTTVISPSKVVEADNNWEILLACLKETTREELKERGIHFTESQLILLQEMRLVEIEEERVRTIMPILGSEKSQSLRNNMRKLAVIIEPELSDEVEALKVELNKMGCEANTYSILFSYILDNIPWTNFIRKGLIATRKLSPKNPLWSGVYWGCYPPRTFYCGTISRDGDQASVKVNWIEEALQVFSDLVWLNLKKLYEDYIDNGKITDQTLREKLEPLHIVDSNGNLTVPIITAQVDNPLYQTCHSIADKIVALFLSHVNLQDLMADYGFPDEEKTLVVSFHEWIWEYIEYLNELEIVKKPIVFSNPEKAKLEDIGALVFIVRWKNTP